MRTIWSARSTIHFDYKHRQDKKDNGRGIARASQAKSVEVVLAHGRSERAEESSGCPPGGLIDTWYPKGNRTWQCRPTSGVGSWSRRAQITDLCLLPFLLVIAKKDVMRYMRSRGEANKTTYSNVKGRSIHLAPNHWQPILYNCDAGPLPQLERA